ncbi:MAG: phosphoribosylglycinamide formyltransferase [Tepidisphaeraceae bacterium]
MPVSPIQLAVLISGGGTTLQNLVQCIHSGKLEARISLVIASKPGIAGIDRAKNAGLKTEIVERKTFADVSEFSRRIFQRCDEERVDLVCLAGWLSLLEIPAKWAGKVMNIHPALLPAFGGAGLYGLRVHQAVLQQGAKVSGCTVHFVDATYDTGPIILQRCCPVLEGDTPDTLAHRVFEEEKIAYPEAIRLFQAGRLRIAGRRAIIL